MTTVEQKTVATSDDIRRVESSISALAVQMQRVEGLIMPRAEIEHGLAQRVSMDAHHGVEERLTRLEQSPQRQVAWYAVAIAGSVGCLTLVVMGLGVATAVASLIVSLLR